jgi:histidinol dehydrogenase
MSGTHTASLLDEDIHPLEVDNRAKEESWLLGRTTAERREENMAAALDAQTTAAAAARRRGAGCVLPCPRIVTDVRKRGDRALLRYAAEFDGLAGAETRCA